MKIKRSPCFVQFLPFRTSQACCYSFLYHMVLRLATYLFIFNFTTNFNLKIFAIFCGYLLRYFPRVFILIAK